MKRIKNVSKCLSLHSPLAATLLITSAFVLPTTAMAANENKEDIGNFTIVKQSEAIDFQVAFVPFKGNSMISSIILDDLATTSLKVTADNLVGQPHVSQELANTLPVWQQTGIPYLVIGHTQTINGNSIIDFEVVETATGRIKMGPQQVTARSMTQAAHQAAARIYELITDNKSDLNASILYVEETREKNKKTSTLILVDAFGNDPEVIAKVTDASIFSPTVSPDSKYIAYSVQLKNNHANLFKQDLRTNQVTPLAAELKGSKLSPNFSFDGSRIIFSSTADGDADIYEVSSVGGPARKIFDMPYDQVDPSYAPDGSFVFASDHARPNYPSIYRFSNGSIDRVTRSGYATKPAYSPDGSKIGYLNGKRAAIMTSSGSNTGQSWSTNLDEAARFSPSGERVVYPQGKNKSTLVIRSLNGGKIITKKLNGTARSPIWIPGR